MWYAKIARLEAFPLFLHTNGSILKFADFVKSCKMKRIMLYLQTQNVNTGKRLKAFSWKDCGTEASMIAIKALSISPDPLSFPGPLDIATNFNIKKTVASPLKVIDIVSFHSMNNFIIRSNWSLYKFKYLTNVYVI